jgi:hypothetical protein
VCEHREFQVQKRRNAHFRPKRQSQQTLATLLQQFGWNRICYRCQQPLTLPISNNFTYKSTFQLIKAKL